ncbi:MAG: autotransporter outer membrane beta-barrel domain-containing protein [Veillonellaceae bacterium]|nr:autotransporter outer membrane beta-barrel domain-containing protein [Veillonellaceae bacterium]
MTKRRKKSLTRQILLGMLAAEVLWGGFAAQAEAEEAYYIKPATIDDPDAACNNTWTEPRNTLSPNSKYKEYAVGYVREGIAANANGNTLTLQGVNFHAIPAGNTTYQFSIYGGKAVGTTSSKANRNTVIVNGGNYEINDLAGGYGPTASYNKVTINDTTGDNTGTLITAQAIMGGGGTGNSDYNTVNINGGKFAVKSIAGGGFSGNSHNNTVNINGGTFSENIKIYGGSTTGGTVSGNTVNITGGTFCKSADIIGGHSLIRTTNNNTVTISGGIFKSGIYLCGGDNAGTNNTLNLKIKGLYVYNAEGFQNLNFYIPNTAQPNDTMLTVGAPAMNLSNATIKAGVQDGSTLKTGDTIYLIKAEDITGYDTITTGTLTDPGYLNYGLEITATNKEVKATIGSVSGLSAESKSLAETRAGGIAILNDGATLMAGTSLVNAKAAANAANLSAQGGEGAPAPAGFTPFAAVGANNMRYETGSYVDSKGWGINVGMARELTYKKSVLTIAPLIEYGRSSYDSYLDSGTHGSGKQQFLGVGAIVRQDFTKGTYVEGSLRAGRMKGDYNSGDMNASYDTASNYFGLHLGVGKIVNLDKKNKLDIYGKLFYTKQAGDDVKLSTGAVYNFEAIDSVRTRLGARWTAELAKNSNLYVGLAWDHEFDSKARATYKGFSTPTPSMKGDSCLLELGWQVKPKETSPLSINLNLTGWCGKQKGVQFGAGFEWGF